ncbi:hypothetical protein HDU99_005417 [Rhizoclosmatium hyalinum]|nr:hypothetical protein HDU99_005417 [Rhizoclosmatium hyalinum]
MGTIGERNAQAISAFLTSPLDHLLSETENDGSIRPSAVKDRFLVLIERARETSIYANVTDFESAPFKGKKDFDLSLSARCVRGELDGLEVIHVSSYKISVISPGNNIPELLRVITSLSPSFHQTIIAGYPPFVKTLIDQGLTLNVPWSTFNLRCIFAGEVFSEEWRTLVATRAGIQTPLKNMVSIYGTADCGVLANETLLSATIRNFLASRPDLMKTLFGKDRIPSFMQYDPLNRYFERHPTDGSLAVTTMPPPPHGDMAMPLVRYCIGDDGGIIGFDELMVFLKGNGYDPMVDLKETRIRKLPFVWVFGRGFWTVSMYGANVYVENIMVGLEQPDVCHLVTGKFVLGLNEDPDDLRLLLRVELAIGVDAGDSDGAVGQKIAASVTKELKRLNSEFANYVPEEKHAPIVHLYNAGDATYFPVGVKHSYIKK